MALWRQAPALWALLALTLCIVMAPLPAAASGETVAIWLTTADQSQLLRQQPSITFGPAGDPNPLTIGVTETTTYQQMVGFGASLTDSSAWLLAAKLSAAQRASVMTKLFDPSRGIGLSFLRQPMGASDFALSNYTYDDMPPGQSDPTLSHFSIGHDLAYIIPLLKLAQQINPALKIMATPWSPPAWMKTTDSVMSGTLSSSADGPLAAYFVKFIQAYTAQGLPIYAISPQNEPVHVTAKSPGMTLTVPAETTLIKSYLAPALAAAGLSTKIIAVDGPWSNLGYALGVMSDPTVRADVAGTAFHCYGGSPSLQGIMQSIFPTKDIYFTECSHGVVTPGPFAQALAYDMHNVLIGATRNWATTVLKWNIALDQNGGPSVWCSFIHGCYGLVTVNTSTGALSYNEDYYALGHLSKFVVPGADRIDTNSYGSGSVEDVAFKNPDGSKVLLVFNGAATASAFTVRWGSQSFADTLPAGAAATFTWTGAPS